MNKKQKIRSQFESQLVLSIKTLFNSVFSANDYRVDNNLVKNAVFLENENMKKPLTIFFIKLLAILLVLYFTIDKFSHASVEAASDALLNKKAEVHEWLAVSIRDEGVAYALIEGYHDPIMANSLAKYFLRIGEDSVAIKLARLSLKLNKQASPEELDASSKKILTEILGH